MDGFDGLIFDLDGTLWDSTAPVAKAWNRVASRIVGHSGIRDEDVARIMGLPHREIFKLMFPDSSPEDREKIARDCYAEEMLTIGSEGGELYGGVADGLAELAKQYPLYLVSNCQTDYLKMFYRVTGLKTHFKDAECHGNTGKPKADNIKFVVERNRLKIPAYIGDTAGDHISAIKAGVEYFHVNYGFGEPDRECPRFNSFDELKRFFLGLRS